MSLTFLLEIFVVILFVVGLFFAFGLTGQRINKDLTDLLAPSKRIREQVLVAQKKKKEGRIGKFLRETRDVMTYMDMGNKLVVVCLISVFLAVLGIVFAILIGNVFLIPAFVLAFFAIPFVVIRLYFYSYSKHIQEELEITLSQITTSYLRTDNIQRAIEENIDNINVPVKDVFAEFLNQVRYVNPDPVAAVDVMMLKLDNNLFIEWCDSLKKCLKNRNMRYLLTPTLTKFSTLRSIENKIVNQLIAIRIEFFTIFGLVWLNVPLIRVLNQEWFAVLTDNIFGKITIGIVALISVICALRLIHITKPMQYQI